MPHGAAHIETLEGRRTIVVDDDRFRSGLPPTLERLIAEMTPLGFVESRDLTLAGTRTACDVLREHRWVVIREGRWLNRRPFETLVGYDNGPRGLVPRGKVVPAGVLGVRIFMCADCGAARIHDVTWEPGDVGPSRRLDHRTGVVRIVSGRTRRDQVIGWYTGARRNGREYR